MTSSFCTTWPHGKTAAASFCFDLDAESAVLSFAPQAASRMSVMSHQSYGPLTGVPRLLRLLEQHGIKATFFVPGYTAHRYPDTIRTIASEGHEIAHHGYLHEPLGEVDEASEIECLERGIAALEEVAGITPVGYRAPMWELNYRSAALLHERGFLYDSSLMDADNPYELATGNGSGLIESPAKTREMWSLELQATTAEGGCFVLTAHPFLTGRPSRAAALAQIMEEAVGSPEVWVATMCEIAAHTRAQALAPRLLTQPEI